MISVSLHPQGFQRSFHESYLHMGEEDLAIPALHLSEKCVSIQAADLAYLFERRRRASR